MIMNDKLKRILARRMRDAVANPPERAFARELLARGMSANEVQRLVVLDPSFDIVPYAFRVAVANEARRLEGERLLEGARRAARARRGMPA
ncbi:MAG TPA: hypothetical protein VNM24_06895 [Burkholderiales bacterium]|nr:hypothetical protein [Burkholderiales bacterium]